jgi:hypothetical protein
MIAMLLASVLPGLNRLFTPMTPAMRIRAERFAAPEQTQPVTRKSHCAYSSTAL